MTNSRPVRILLVDDHEFIRRGLRDLIETHHGWEVCGEACDGRMAVELTESLRPQVIVMDLTMPRLNGWEAARRILLKDREVQIVMLSMHESDQHIREALAAGVRGYVLKSDAGKDLVAAVKALLRGETYFTSPIAGRIYREEFARELRGRSRRAAGPLTSRERETLQLLAEGKTNKETGESLGISVKTVETHRARIMRKLSIDNVADLVRYAIRNGIAGL